MAALGRNQAYFTRTTASSIMVGEKGEMPGETQRPSAGCLLTYPRMAGEDASISETWTRSHRFGEKLLGHCSEEQSKQTSSTKIK